MSPSLNILGMLVQVIQEPWAPVSPVIVMQRNIVRLYPTFYFSFLNMVAVFLSKEKTRNLEGTVGGHRVCSNILGFLTVSWIDFNVPWSWSNEKKQKRNIHLPSMAWQCVFIDKSSSRNECSIPNWTEGEISVNIAEGVWGNTGIWQWNQPLAFSFWESRGSEEEKS